MTDIKVKGKAFITPKCRQVKREIIKQSRAQPKKQEIKNAHRPKKKHFEIVPKKSDLFLSKTTEKTEHQEVQ